MSTSTLTRPPELSEPQDPWLRTSHTVVHPNLQTLPYMSPQQESHAFDTLVANYPASADQNTVVHSPTHAAPDVMHDDKPTDVKPNHTPRHRWTPERDYTPTPAADIERRRRANLQASLALAHTLRDTNPELMRGLITTKTEPVTEVTAAERPHKYRGTRRKLGRLARLFSRFSR